VGPYSGTPDCRLGCAAHTRSFLAVGQVKIRKTLLRSIGSERPSIPHMALLLNSDTVVAGRWIDTPLDAACETQLAADALPVAFPVQLNG